MLSFLKKLLQSVITLWGVSVVIFLLLFWVPRLGQEDPTTAIAQVMAGDHANAENIENIKNKYGLNRPMIVQYRNFLSDVATNKLQSYRNKEYVFPAIKRRFPATLLLAVTALTLYLAIAIPVSLITSSRPGSWLDKGGLFLSIVAISIPTFWLGRLLQNYLGYQWGWFSVGGAANIGNLPLPALTLACSGAAYYSRLLHANLRGVLKQDYIRAARARGLSEGKVLSKHALKNAIIPAVAVLGAEFASLLSGLIFTEKIFGWPGIGSLAVDSVSNNDVPMIMGTVLFSALMVVVGNIVVDLVYRIIDPRVRAS